MGPEVSLEDISIQNLLRDNYNIIITNVSGVTAKNLIKAMKEYGKDQFNAGLRKAAEEAKVTIEEQKDDDGDPIHMWVVDKNSILKHLKQ